MAQTPEDLAKALRNEGLNVPPPTAPLEGARKRKQRLRKVSDVVERVWVSPRCGGDFIQWKMK